MPPEPLEIESADAPPLALRPARFSPVAVGTICCAVAAMSYTASNICLRQLAQLKADYGWVTCNKELVTVLCLGPWLAVEWLRGRKVVHSWRAVGAIVLVGLAVQLFGNQLSQWAMGVVGLAVNIPVILGASLVGSAVLGRLVLGERVTPRSAVALGLLLIAGIVLGVGAEQAAEKTSADAAASAAHAANAPRPTPTRPLTICMAVLAGVSAGTVYALLSITIRRTVTGATRGTLLMFLVTLMGVVSLGPLSWQRLGGAALWATPREQILWMAAAGLANFVGFVAITQGLARTTVIHANVLNASQVAMAALAGIFLFAEPLTPWLTLGVVLTICGIILVKPASKSGVETVPAGI